MTDNPWFLAIVVIEAIGVGIGLALDGKPRETPHSFVVSVIAAAISLALIYKAIGYGK